MNGRRSFFGTVAGAATLLQGGHVSAEAPAKQGTGAFVSICCPVVELRQYTVRGGRQAEFKRLFGTTFVTPQAAAGIRVLGWFDDLDDPDRFVWMRGFASMEARAAALATFYGGDVWKAHRDEANAMIVDSDNVLLLRPPAEGGGMILSADKLAGVLSATIHYLPSRDTGAFDSFFSARMLPRIQAHGASVIGRLCSYEGANNFPRLPVRENESVYVWIAQFDSETAQATFATRMHAESGWRDGTSDPLLATVMRKPEVLRLRS